MKMSLIKTVICDDIQKDLEMIRAALNAYAETHSELHFDIDEYGTAIDVLHAIEKGRVYDLPFWIFVCRVYLERMSRRKCLRKVRIWVLFF